MRSHHTGRIVQYEVVESSILEGVFQYDEVIYLSVLTSYWKVLQCTYVVLPFIPIFSYTNFLLSFEFLLRLFDDV